MATPRSALIEALDEQGNGVRVEFNWCGDRFGHTLCSVRGGTPEPIFRSVEGTPNEPWPPSPAYQELSEFAPTDGERSLLLTGMSGTSHWSVGIESEDGRLHFDLAVRLKAPPPQIAAKYELCNSAQWQDHPERLLAVGASPSHSIAIELGGLPLSATQPVDEAQHRTVQSSLPIPRDFPATYRWQYWISPATT